MTQKIKHIDLNKSESSGDLKRVQKYTIDFDDSRIAYEDLLNDPNKTILKEISAYDKSGRSVITVWWSEKPKNS